jgi:hypothetical protein
MNFFTSLRYALTQAEEAGDGERIDSLNSLAATLFAGRMAETLQRARVTAGRWGWQNPAICQDVDLKVRMQREAAKPKPSYVKVAVYAMMLHYRTGQHDE